MTGFWLVVEVIVRRLLVWCWIVWIGCGVGGRRNRIMAGNRCCLGFEISRIEDWEISMGKWKSGDFI